MRAIGMLFNSTPLGVVRQRFDSDVAEAALQGVHPCICQGKWLLPFYRRWLASYDDWRNVLEHWEAQESVRR